MIIPGLHTYDGSYTELTLSWHGIEVLVQSAMDGDADLIILVTPHKLPSTQPASVIETGFLWNRSGTVRHDGDTLLAQPLTARDSRVPAQRDPLPPQEAITIRLGAAYELWDCQRTN